MFHGVSRTKVQRAEIMLDKSPVEEAASGICRIKNFLEDWVYGIGIVICSLIKFFMGLTGDKIKLVKALFILK